MTTDHTETKTDREADAPTGENNAPTVAVKAHRRGFLKTVGAGAMAGALGVGLGSGSVSADEHMDSFVETEGTDFVVDGESVYFNGMNNFWITDDDANEATEERVDQVFDLFASLGIDLVRIWAHGEAKDGALTVQPEPGEHNEDALAHHDYVIEAARERGIRLIIALVDNWDHEGGMLQYAEWTGGNSRHHFYTDEEARDLYMNHVETIVTRENSISGVEWRNDPTIMMWELANEPRLEADDTDDGEFDRDIDEHKEILGDWIADMSSYIKSLDDNHLVSTGSEGHYYGGYDDEYPYGNWDGQDYIEHHEIETIDACSFHWYPDHWEMALDHGTQWVTEHVEDAHEIVGKPAYLGEFNVNIDNGLEARNQHLEEWYDAADESDCNAVLPWQLVLDSTEDHDGFQLYEDESGYLIEDFADVVAEKSGDTGGTDPDPGPGTPADYWTNEVTETEIEIGWDAVDDAVSYNVYLEGTLEVETSDTVATLAGLEADTGYVIGLSAVGDDGSESDVVSTTVTTDGDGGNGDPDPEYPEWDPEEVYTDGEMVTWDGSIWEAQWWTQDQEPREEDGYVWQFVEDVESGNGDDPDPSDEPPELDGYEPSDSTGDGLANDFTGNGQTGTTDVNIFFENVDNPDVTGYPDHYDFTGNGEVSLSDVIELFESI